MTGFILSAEVIFDIFMTVTLSVTMITRQKTPFFHLHFELSPLVCFICGFQQDLQNSIPLGLLFTCFGLQNTHLHAKDVIFVTYQETSI